MEQTNLIVAVLAALEQQIKVIVAAQVAEALAAQPKQEATPQTIDVPAFIDTIDKQKWFWAKMQTFVEKELDSQIEQAIDAHCSDYDHDEYDSTVRNLNDYFVTKDDINAKVEEAVDDMLEDKIEDKARELLRNASISIDV